MNSRKPSPYVTFNAYNTIDRKPDEMNRAAMQPQQQQQQMQPQPQPQQQQMQPQQQQQQMQHQQEHGPSRFKPIHNSEHLYTVLTKGVEHFIESFKAKNMQPPPMKVFLKLYTDWCGPCKKIAPFLDEQSMNYPDIIFLQFDADLMIKGQDQFSKELVKMLKIGAVPAFFTFVNGRIVGSVMGAERAEIKKLLDDMH